ncbi:MAG: Rrf2 family transcriptional regulator [Gemmobacter sp.]|nr:Rrf2 family transcriptional regulator [Gemmobacter sp.]
MRVTIRTSLALRALMYCAVNPGRIVRKHDIAEACKVSENHLAQVVHALGQQGFLSTLRGRSGGLTLGRPMAEITVGQVFRALEAGVPLTECQAGIGDCPLRGCCRLRCVLAEALDAFYARLDQVTLADLVTDNASLEHLLRAA